MDSDALAISLERSLPQKMNFLKPNLLIKPPPYKEWGRSCMPEKQRRQGVVSNGYGKYIYFIFLLMLIAMVHGQNSPNNFSKSTKSIFINEPEKLNELFEKIKIGNASQFDGIPFVIPSIDILDKQCQTKLKKIEPNTILNIKNWKLKKAISFYDIYPSGHIQHTMGIIIARPITPELQCAGEIVSIFYFVKFFPNNVIQYGILIWGENARGGTIQESWDHYNKLCNNCGDINVYD